MLRRLDDSFCTEDITRELHVTPAKASSVVRELEQRGWLEPVSKSELSDRRR